MMDLIPTPALEDIGELRKRISTLAQLDQLKTDFVANISHELRTPLTLILAPLRSILSGQYGEIPAQSRPIVERVLRNTVRLNGLVNDLLDVSKLEAGKMQVRSGPVDPVEIVSMLVAELGPAARERRLLLNIETLGWPVGVHATLDAQLFEKITLNLLSNAFKFTSEEGQVSLSLALRDQEIVLRVSDTGVGIPADKKGLLFQRFQQVDSPTSRYTHGTGLGLALVKEFAELMKGRVGVESEFGVGSTFSVHLPFLESTENVIHRAALTREVGEMIRSESHARSSGNESAVESERGSTSPNGNALPLLVIRPSVLVVEDNPDLQQYVQETLSSYYRVYTASNGEQALAVLRKQEIDVILSDVSMPVMDGLTLLKKVKAHPAHRFIPFILLTARIAREDRLQGLDEGADDYLTKPFDGTELLTRLRCAVRTRALYRELEAKNHELEAAKRGLQRKVDERTYELSLQSQKAMSANKSKDQFLANMSHEMRTPLTAIIGFSDLIAGGVSSHEAIEFQDTIRRNASHLLSLIDEILDFSKIESGTMTIERSAIETADFFHTIESSFLPEVERKKIELKVKLGPDVAPAVITDPKRLRQMVTNLIGNAVKFTDAGTVQVEVQVIDDRGRPQLRIRVIDSGIGIEPASQDKLFSPFAQADMALSRKYGGTGLGLALSRKIARALGGELMIESSLPGQGSTFALWVPIEIPEMSERVSDDAKSIHRLSAALATKPLSGLKILLAEDSVDNQRLLRRLIEGAGATMGVASNGVEAVRLATSQNFDVILMDIQMPILDGFNATKQIRATGYTKPILALTAHASDEDLDRILEAGCNDRLVKPIDLDQLVSSILASTSLQRC
jgi:signal transduction histidine kinase